MIKNPRRLRSMLHFELLTLLAGHVVAPILIAELWDVARRMRSQTAWMSGRKGMFYRYLHRLADVGLLKVTRVHDRLAVLLTKEGERELERFRRRGGRAGHSLVPHVGQSHSPAPTAIRRAFQLVGGGVRETNAFVSYDVPVEAEVLRCAMARTLREGGFDRLHESMWIGDPRRLPAVIAWAERQELLPHLKWGAIQVFPSTDPKGNAPRVPESVAADSPRRASARRPIRRRVAGVSRPHQACSTPAGRPVFPPAASTTPVSPGSAADRAPRSSRGPTRG